MVLLRAIHSKANNQLVGHLFLGVRPSHFASIFEDVDLGTRHRAIFVLDAEAGSVVVKALERAGDGPTRRPTPR